jgi:hypothetical protein
MQEMKHRILSFASKADRPLTSELIQDEFSFIASTAQKLLYGLAIEGYLRVVSTKTWVREFLPEKDRILRERARILEKDGLHFFRKRK